MNKPPGGHHTETMITVLNNVGRPWVEAKISHNGKTLSTNVKGKVLMIINGGAVRINGIPVTDKIQKGVENIFRYSTRTGSFKKQSTDSDNILILPSGSHRASVHTEK